MLQEILFSPIRPVVRGIGAFRRSGVAAAQLLTVPIDFGWIPPLNVFKTGEFYSTDYDPTPFLVEGDTGVTTFYIDGQTGNDSNPGTSALPKRSFYPVTGGRVNKLLLKVRGIFYRNTASYIQYEHDNLCVEAWGGADAIFTNETDPAYPFVWTSEGNGTWSSPWPAGGTNTPNDVYSGTEVDSIIRLLPVGSTALCLSTAGSFAIDWGGGKQWVHTSDGSSPATGHTLYGTNSAGGYFECSENAYAQRAQFVGLQFRGGSAAYQVCGDSAYSKSIEFVGCSFKRANNFAAFHAQGNSKIILYECVAGPTVFDGFSGSTASGSVGGNVPSIIEIGCIATKCGDVSTGSNQGSTTHFGGKIIRVNGQYYNNADDQIADVGEGTRSWNVGCTFGPKGLSNVNSGVQVGNNATAVSMWLDGCSFSGTTYQAGISSGGMLYYKNMPAPTLSPSSTGVLATY